MTPTAKKISSAFCKLAQEKYGFPVELSLWHKELPVFSSEWDSVRQYLSANRAFKLGVGAIEDLTPEEWLTKLDEYAASVTDVWSEPPGTATRHACYWGLPSGRVLGCAWMMHHATMHEYTDVMMPGFYERAKGDKWRLDLQGLAELLMQDHGWTWVRLPLAGSGLVTEVSVRCGSPDPAALEATIKLLRKRSRELRGIFTFTLSSVSDCSMETYPKLGMLISALEAKRPVLAATPPAIP
ncbi:hypothetical protein ACFOY8_13950 [Thalassospira xianhensis]|uniref:Uncharacterized protein n=1 Tax=Thalassospira xianhensis MCCC 1A02616 TaxID=1177929 RepID=A0A367UHE1_9PROT|nr:hypothetical protein [Thalassospira xianhensis]RCK07735.1 hypothetical protein TH5_01325 [Thalassospira xianhensis MCCC 1A02616]